jgi:hypothetical protein
MSAQPSRFPSPPFRSAVGLGVGLAAGLLAPSAHGQACCAGTGAVTPGRLALHEDALVGIQAKTGTSIGSFDPNGNYVAQPANAAEVDFEQDLFGALRFLRYGQASLLVPLVETWRTLQGPPPRRQLQSEAGAGLGDVNANVRYDFYIAGRSRTVPGIAALGGVTFPTGTPADAPGLGPLVTGATGIGAFQFNLGLALEQTFGPWLVNATGIVSQRTARTVGSGPSAVSERLGVQWSALAAVAYTFESDAAVALSASEVIQGDAVVNGADSPGSGYRLFTLTASGVLPIADAFRLQGAVFDNLPVPALSASQPSDLGVLLTAVRSWR